MKMIESLMDPVGDGPVRKEGCKASFACLDQCIFPADVEKGTPVVLQNWHREGLRRWHCYEPLHPCPHRIPYTAFDRP